MTRKLHNTLMAAIASSSLLVVGIIASSPVAPTAEATSTAGMLAAIDTQAESTADASDQAEAAPTRKPVRYRRQSLAMPFYSFAPRS